MWLALAIMVLAAGVFAGAVVVSGRLDDLTIKREKICSESNQGACVALFDRLAANITPAQRLELACLASGVFADVPAVRQLRADHDCPPLRR